MEQLPAAKHRRALESFKAANPEHWHDVLRNTFNNVSSKLCPRIRRPPHSRRKFEQLKETLAASSASTLPAANASSGSPKIANDSFADILGPEVFRAMLTAMERDQFNEKRSNRLRDYISRRQELLVELIGSADLEVIKDLTRALQLSPCFDDMDKRSLLARIVKSYPRFNLSFPANKPSRNRIWSFPGTALNAARTSIANLSEKKIPANSKEIAIARSYGDLRENHEYKAAKEMQSCSCAARPSSKPSSSAPADRLCHPRTDVAGMGTIVRAIDLETGQPEHFTILGAWDSDPDKGVVSYLSPVAQSLLNKKIGEELNSKSTAFGIATASNPLSRSSDAPAPVAEVPVPQL